MSETDIVRAIDPGELESRAHSAAAHNDLETVGACVREADEAQRRFLQQMQDEDRLYREQSRELGTLKSRLAALPEAEARQRHADATFSVDYHADRARLCQQHADAIGKTLTVLRRLSEECQGRQLAERIFLEAETLADRLDEAKKDLAPLLALVERCYTLQRTIEEWNLTSQTAKLPMPQVRGDVGAVNRLNEIRLDLPGNWRALLAPTPARKAHTHDELRDRVW